MNPWMRGLQIVTSTLSVIVSICAFAGLVVVLWKRKRIEEIMRTRPYRTLPWSRCWIMAAIGVLFLLAFEFIVTPHLGIHLSLRTQVLLSLVTVLMYVGFSAAFFAAAQRIPTWPLATRIRTMYVMVVVACILAVASLYHVFW
jgi:hypothetical protein